MSGLDPRAQLAAFAALFLATLFGGPLGLAGGLAAACVWLAAQRLPRPALRALAASLPLAIAVLLLDALAGRGAEGLAAALRLGAATGLAAAFAGSAEPRGLAAALRALAVPYPIVFVLVAGARFIPLAAADLGALTDAARLRGMTIGGTLRRRLADWAALLVPLLVLTIRRGLQLGEAMEARGFHDGSRGTLRATLRWRGRDTAVTSAAAAWLLALVLAGAR